MLKRGRDRVPVARDVAHGLPVSGLRLIGCVAVEGGRISSEVLGHTLIHDSADGCTARGCLAREPSELVANVGGQERGDHGPTVNLFSATVNRNRATVRLKRLL